MTSKGGYFIVHFTIQGKYYISYTDHKHIVLDGKRTMKADVYRLYLFILSCSKKLFFSLRVVTFPFMPFDRLPYLFLYIHLIYITEMVKGLNPNFRAPQ